MKESKNNSSINIGALLEALSLHSSTSNSSTVTVQSLADEINESLGPYADRQLCEDLAQVLLNCKERYLSQEDISKDSDEDLDNHNRIRESSRSRSHTHTEQKTSMGLWRASTPSLEMEDDEFEGQDASFQSVAARNDDVDEEVKEDLFASTIGKSGQFPFS